MCQPPTSNAGDTRDRASQSMQEQEYRQLVQLLDSSKPTASLEIGLANGGSAVAICRAVRAAGGTKHVAVDPFQSAPVPEGFDAGGITRVQEAGFGDMLEMIEDYDYFALPELLRAKREFDFILINGWHSFDHTFHNIFYADLLLKPGGVLVVHDTGWPSVYRACRFLETHKPYDRLGPPMLVMLDPLMARLARRARIMVSGAQARADAKSRREDWKSLGAWRKREPHLVPCAFYAPF